MSKKVLIVALGDVYWTKFAKYFSSLAANDGVECVIAFESRAGEYQAFLGRSDYEAEKVYYLSDYVDVCTDYSDGDPAIVFGDYLRMMILGQRKEALNKNWSKASGLLDSFAKHVLDSENIGVIVSDTVSTGLSYAFNQEAVSRDIEYVGLSGSRIPKHFIASRTIRNEADVVESYYKEILDKGRPVSDEERYWAESYIRDIDNQIPDYMASPILNSVSMRKYFRVSYFKSLVGACLYSLIERNDSRNIVLKAAPTKGLITAIIRNLRRLLRANRVCECYSPISTLLNRKYFVYPIHYQPEATTVIGSPYHVDQLAVIRNLAFSLPKGFFLCVKEHISNVGFPSLSFYQEIIGLPNVVLVSHDEDMKNLIRKSAGVVTLTSTAGFEALLLNRPVFHFGDIFYSFHPCAVRLSDWGKVKEILSENNQGKEFDNVDFLVAYKRYAIEGRIDFSRTDFGISSVLMGLIKSKI
ncbi:MAG: hypothetical protein EP324_08605 [Gammaproteobacteria bacterium]|nr:MAG: hypothetical protein EP324_08605 [Gammaproteobacteria bacterium]